MATPPEMNVKRAVEDLVQGLPRPQPPPPIPANIKFNQVAYDALLVNDAAYLTANGWRKNAIGRWTSKQLNREVLTQNHAVNCQKLADRMHREGFPWLKGKDQLSLEYLTEVRKFEAQERLGTMYTTYLIQRLTQKPKSEMAGKVSRVFGNSRLGLGTEAWDQLQGVFDLDYMGSAEYEMGKIPSVLHSLIQDQDSLVSFEMVLERKDVKLNYYHKLQHQKLRDVELREAKKAGVKAKRAKPFKDANFTPKTVYVLCRKAHKTRVEETIRELALGKCHTKGNPLFDTALDPSQEWDCKTIGWLELDNGFFFFTDKEAFDGTCNLFAGEEKTSGVEEA